MRDMHDVPDSLWQVHHVYHRTPCVCVCVCVLFQALCAAPIRYLTSETSEMALARGVGWCEVVGTPRNSHHSHHVHLAGWSCNDNSYSSLLQRTQHVACSI